MLDTVRQRLRRAAAHRRFPALEFEMCSADEVARLGYASQIGQDLLLDRHVFGGELGGVFVDVGAHDGETFSNTLFLEEQRGWTGVCIEPHRDVFARLATRRAAQCVECAVGASEGTADFRAISGYGEMLSGIVAKSGPAHDARIKRDIERHGGSFEVRGVAVRRLDKVLWEAGLDQIDLLCIDVEGAELDVLDSLDLDAFQVRVVLLENNFGDVAVPKAMKRKGYQLFVRLGWDECYVRNPMRMASGTNAGRRQ